MFYKNLMCFFFCECLFFLLTFFQNAHSQTVFIWVPTPIIAGMTVITTYLRLLV